MHRFLGFEELRSSGAIAELEGSVDAEAAMDWFTEALVSCASDLISDATNGNSATEVRLLYLNICPSA